MRTTREIDRHILELASRNRSVVHARSLREAGIGRDAVRRRVAEGWMCEALPRTYIVGPECHEPSFETQCMVGVQHAGEDSFIDGETAALLLNVWDRGDGRIHVTGPGLGSDRSHASFAFHRAAASWVPASMQLVNQLPVVGFIDMCVRLSRSLTYWQLAYVIRRGLHEGYVSILELESMIIALAGIPSIKVLRLAVALVRGNSYGTRSRSEDFLLPALVERLGEPTAVNVLGSLGIPRDEPDFVWDRPRLNVEVDGVHHLEPSQMADDHDRDAKVLVRGCPVVRIAYPYVWSCRARVVEHVVRVAAGTEDDLARFSWARASPDMVARYISNVDRRWRSDDSRSSSRNREPRTMIIGQ